MKFIPAWLKSVDSSITSGVGDTGAVDRKALYNHSTDTADRMEVAKWLFEACAQTQSFR